MENNLNLQVEYLRPLYVKLKVDEEIVKDQLVDEDNKGHLPGYLPEEVEAPLKAQRQRTVARMLVPFARIPFIKQTFGDRIYSGEGCLLSCLYSTVEVILDSRKEICRLNVPKWRKLEELNVLSVTQRVLKEQFAANAT